MVTCISSSWAWYSWTQTEVKYEVIFIKHSKHHALLFKITIRISCVSGALRKAHVFLWKDLLTAAGRVNEGLKEYDALRNQTGGFREWLKYNVNDYWLRFSLKPAGLTRLIVLRSEAREENRTDWTQSEQRVSKFRSLLKETFKRQMTIWLPNGRISWSRRLFGGTEGLSFEAAVSDS